MPYETMRSAAGRPSMRLSHLAPRSLRAFGVAPVCSMPYEYCEWGPSPALCREQLAKEDPDLFKELYEGGKRTITSPRRRMRWSGAGRGCKDVRCRRSVCLGQSEGDWG